MTLSGKVDDAVHMLVLHQLVNRLEVADVGLHELFVFGILVHEKAHDMVSDETSTAGDDDGAFVSHCFSVLLQIL